MEETIHVPDNPPSIEHILRPISYISWLMGVGVAHPRRCPKVITIIIRIVHLAMYFYVLVNFIVIVRKISFNVLTIQILFSGSISSVISYVSGCYYIYYGISQYNKWPELMDRMKKLDQKIRKEISMDDQPAKNFQAIAILAVFAWFPLYPIICTLYTHLYSSPFSIKWWNVYIKAQSWVNSFVFDVVIYVLYCRFQTINKLIGQLDQLDAQQIAFQIRRIRELHNGICGHIIMINDIHGVHLLLSSMDCFAKVVTLLYQLYVCAMVYKCIIMTDIYLYSIYTLYVIQFGLMCWICTLACKEFQKTGTFLYNIDLNSKNLERNCITKEVNDFSIQLQQHRVAFTACDFFEVNNALFSRFFEVTITYLIILIQFTPKVGVHHFYLGRQILHRGITLL
ncbi:gustatory receptor 23a [Solenopsis invicta]|uniref:gustatory receptor 23a n=1 Tax=Solenopsis invicta TaxID=13686 RepID=UPI000E33E72C|nr:gustatory receptor 23a [Solenopsis invicta]